MDRLDQFVATSLVNQAILLDGAINAGIAVSDDELRDTVINIRTDADGNFVPEDQWSRWINRTYNQQVGSYEKYLRDHEIRYFKFQRLFASSAYIPESLIKERFIKDNEKVKLEMVVLNTFEVREQTKLEDDAAVQAFYEKHNDLFVTGDQRVIQFINFPVNDYLAEVVISDEEMQAFYNENKARYLQQESVKAKHILIKTSDAKTEEQALAEIVKIKKEIEDGLAFEEAAKKYSEDEGSGKAGGDLGEFGKGRMVPEFENTAFALEIGAMSEPVKTQFGYHIILKEGHQPEKERAFDEVKAGIRTSLSREKAKKAAMDKALAFREQVIAGKGFDVAAKEMTYTVSVSPPFDNDPRANLGEVLNTNYQVQRAAFAIPTLNEISPVIDGGTQIVVAQWVDEVAPRAMDFEKDKARIKTMAEKLSGQEFIKGVSGRDSPGGAQGA